MVVGEVKEELLDAEERVHLGEHLELSHLPDEPADLQFGLNVDLILLPDVPPEVLQRCQYHDMFIGTGFE